MPTQALPTYEKCKGRAVPPRYLVLKTSRHYTNTNVELETEKDYITRHTCPFLMTMMCLESEIGVCLTLSTLG